MLPSILCLRYLKIPCPVLTQKFCNQDLKFQETDEIELIEAEQGRILTIGINLPDIKNVLNEHCVERLTESVRWFNDNSKCQIAVIHGIGGNLCTGLSGLSADSEPAKKLLKNVFNSRKPIIAAVSGFTTSFGFQLALSCDLRVVEDTSVLGIGEESISNFFATILVAHFGLSNAMNFVLTKRNLKAKESLELGLATRLVSCGTGLGQAVSVAKCVIKYPEQQLLADRMALRKIIRFQD